MLGGAEKYLIPIFGHNFSIDFRHKKHYVYNVLTRPTTIIITSHFVLPVVLAEIHTSRREALHKH